MALHDKDIRESLFDFLEAEYGKIRIIEEKTMGRSRADVVMVTEDALFGIEIKSDADTWGIITVEQDENDESALDFYILRRPERNTKRDMLKKVSLLWRPEMAHILAAEKLPKYSGKNKRYITKIIADKIPEENLDRMISEVLFERDYTVFDDEM